jgi:raffinose/stachyose/melibiose transport system substrate-binding protein
LCGWQSPRRFAAALLVGAGGASAKPQQQVTLKLLAAIQNEQGTDVIIANFQRVYPNIRVEATYVDSTAYGPLLLTQLQAGNEADIFTGSLGGSSNTSSYPLAAQGRLLDLSGSPWVKRVVSDARRYSSRQHKIYALPLGYNLQGLMYNTDLFASLGLKEPTTFNELLALCGKIRAAGKIR